MGYLFNSIALAGGKSLRLGRNKLLEDVGGKTLLSRVLGTLSSLKGEVIIVASATQPVPSDYIHPGITVRQDIFPESGPLGGIYTGLAASGCFHNLVVACDMPFLNSALLEYMLEKTVDYDIVIPRLDGFIEPLHAVYSQNCLPYIRHEIDSGHRNIRSFFPKVKVRYIERIEIDRFDPDHLSFFNINTEEDLEKARELAGKRKEFYK